MPIALRILPLLILAASPAAGQVAIAAIDPPHAVLASDAETRWVPFDLTPGNQIRFTMRIDGQPLAAVLDTGVSFSVLARHYADAHKIAVTAGGSATAIGGSVAISSARARIVELGGMTRTGGGLSVADLPALATGSATAVDILVGPDLIGGYALDIDYAAKRFRLLPTGRLPFVGATAPLSVSNDRHVYVGAVTLGAAQLRPMIVDTGDGSSVTVSEPGWQAAHLTGLPTTTSLAFGLAGSLVSQLAIVPALRTGDLAARHVEVRIEPAGGFSESIGVAGRIGSGFLQNYRVLLDPTAGRMILKPGAGADRMPLKSTSGLLLGLLPDRLRVLQVMRNSPADGAGWKAGDTICRVDGQPIDAAYATSALARWSAGTPGRVVSLALCDGTMRRLTLRTFY